MITEEEAVVSQVEETPAGGNDAEPAPEGPVYINLTVRLSVEDHARIERLADIAHKWQIIERPSLAAIIRYGLALAEAQVKAVYVQKRGGVH